MSWYAEYLRSPHWRRTRARRLEQADWQCERCGEFGKRGPRGVVLGLHVHHLNYDRIGKELPSDLSVLCICCHEDEHGRAQDTPERREQVRVELSRRLANLTARYVPGDEDYEEASWREAVAAAELGVEP